MASSKLAKAIDEIDTFEKAKAAFLADVKEKHRDDAREWLKSQDSAHEAQRMCQTLSDQGEAQYSSKGSFTLGGHNALPKKVVTKLLDNINTFVSVGDFALKGGPESVTACRFPLITLSADYD
jgi:ABC-type transporter Mla subunit MlaD